MRAAIYARVSDDKLKEDGTRRQDVERQVALLLPLAQLWLDQHPDWEKEIIVFKDDGKSAFKEDYGARPEFMKQMNEIRACRIQRIWVESLDRWSRRVVDGLTTLKTASDSGCTIVSIAEGEQDWTQPQGWFKSLIALGMAEWASRDKSWKVSDGMKRRANDPSKICLSCNEVHLGRHPLVCQCKACKKRVGKN